MIILFILLSSIGIGWIVLTDMPLVDIGIDAGLVNNNGSLPKSGLVSPVQVKTNISYGTHTRNNYDVYYRTSIEDAPIVFLIHGGGAGKGSKDNVTPMTDIYTDLGFVTVVLEYGSNNDVRINVNEMACGMASFISEAGEYGGDSSRVIVHGFSFGGNSGAIVYDQGKNWLSDCSEKTNDMHVISFIGQSSNNLRASINKISKGEPPAMFLFGADDPELDISEPRTFIDRLNAKGIYGEVHIVQGIGHGPPGHTNNAEVAKIIQDYVRGLFD